MPRYLQCFAVLLLCVLTPALAWTQQRVAFDFRGGPENPAPLRLFGPDVNNVTQADARSLRFTLPKGRANSDVVGADIPLRLRGDFEIVLGYELLAIDEPTNDRGSGVQFRVNYATAVPQISMMSRVRKNGKESVGYWRQELGPDGKERFPAKDGGSFVTATTTQGKFRLVRTGPRVEYFVAEGAADFKSLFDVDIGTEDVTSLRLVALSGYQPTLADVRFSDLTIRSGELLAAAPVEQAVAEAAPAPRRSALFLALGLFGVLLVTGALAAFFFLQKKKPESEGEP
jgi:hypothetical protein